MSGWELPSPAHKLLDTPATSPEHSVNNDPEVFVSPVSAYELSDSSSYKSFANASLNQSDDSRSSSSSISILDKPVLNVNHIRKEVLNRKKQQVSQDCSALITNVDQLPNKINELKSLIYANDYDIILLTEVCPKNSTNQLLNSHVSLQGYHTISNLSSNYCRRGTLALVKSSYTVTPIDYFTGCPYAETIFFLYFSSRE